MKSRITRHHLTPRSRGGNEAKSNLLRLKRKRHWYWHYVFKLLTLEEVIMLLVRVHRAKKRCLKPCPFCGLTLE